MAECGFCKGGPVGNAATWLDGVPRPPAPCPRCGETHDRTPEPVRSASSLRLALGCVQSALHHLERTTAEKNTTRGRIEAAKVELRTAEDALKRDLFDSPARLRRRSAP